MVAVAILLSVTSVVYAVAAPQQGESYTEFYLLNETANGTLTADDYPTNYTADTPRDLVVGIGNHEQRQQSYTVVAELQRLRIENSTATVTAERELDRFRVSLAHNETVQRTRTVRPTMTGERLRLIYFLYRGDPPADPSRSNAYRSTFLFINVTSENR